MLVLSRKLGETITIADNITVQLMYVGKGRVRLGIVAPPEIPIRRTQTGSAESQGLVATKDLEPACSA